MSTEKENVLVECEVLWLAGTHRGHRFRERERDQIVRPKMCGSYTTTSDIFKEVKTPLRLMRMEESDTLEMQ